MRIDHLLIELVHPEACWKNLRRGIFVLFIKDNDNDDVYVMMKCLSVCMSRLAYFLGKLF